ncbi:hypothetical protein M8A51_19075 [Schlegelella sp. S2-27]|uniref:DUF4124 domain-containing protein n=2 Tax=Caldimonas mangrovi TaxID=2944811 RepID=A0ABT0YTM8_9BURK|nr:hypothetical protein [Caldimonas mangrovi]
MRLTCSTPSFVACLVCAAALAVGPAIAAEGERAPQTVYQQRLPDGRIVFSDRPEPGAVTERNWSFVPDDPVQAAARREAARAEANEIHQRVQRAADYRQQLDNELEIERMRRAQALALLEAERERTARQLAEQTPPAVVIPGWHRPWLPGVRPAPRPPWEPRPWSAPAARPADKPASLNVPRR